MKSNFERNSFVIAVRVTDLILTPLTCATLVNEILKNLIYQKSQIPYPYNWLENAVKRKRRGLVPKEEKTTNFSVERYYKIASTAYDASEDIMKHISREFLNHEDVVKEVSIIFGSTPLCAKEIFNIQIPFINKEHREENHINAIHKHQHTVLREIFLSEDWVHAMETSVPSTNTYVMLKKIRGNEGKNSNDFFTSRQDYCAPSRTRCFTVQLISDDSISSNCCNNLLIYSDLHNSQIRSSPLTDDSMETNKMKESDELENDVLKWYQAKLVIQGFKDLFINRVSASKLW